MGTDVEISPTPLVDNILQDTGMIYIEGDKIIDELGLQKFIIHLCLNNTRRQGFKLKMDHD